MAIDDILTDKPRPRKSPVYKSGYLHVSSRGLGWTTWKRRWFLLTRTSLLYFKAEPEGNINGSMALGGIDLNSSGSLQSKADKKQVTLSFPDGRAYTLRAEDTDDYEEWREALEEAVTMAPSPVLMGQGGVDLLDSISESHVVDKTGGMRRAFKSLVVGRPVLLALEEIDGSPCFLEKAMRFLEQYGAKTEGILRESADVDDVEKRIVEYEQGETEFSQFENPHVIGDCIKHVLREMPSAIIPAPCCLSLEHSISLSDNASKIEAVKMILEESFPEPNRRLLQRVVKMMRTVVQHEPQNRMNQKAMAMCMGPLILRPLFAVDSGQPDAISSTMDEGAQILAAARSASKVQAIMIFLMENYTELFTLSRSDSLVKSASMLSLNPSLSLRNEPDDDDIVMDEFDDVNDDELSGPGPVESASGGRKEGGSFQREQLQSIRETMDSFGSFSFQEPHLSSMLELPSPKVELARQQYLPPAQLPIPSNGRPSEDLKARRPPLAAAEAAAADTSSSHARNRSLPQLDTAGQASFSTGTPRGIRSELQMETEKLHSVPAGDDETQVRMMELTRQDLRTALSKELRANTALREGLSSRKSQLMNKKLTLQKEMSLIKAELESQKQRYAEEERNMGRNGGPTPILDAKVIAELDEIGSIEKDVVRLKSDLGHLRRQLVHIQQYQQNPTSVTAKSSTERRQKVQSLLDLKAELHSELERTMALCLEEQKKNAKLEEKRKQDNPGALESSVSQQKASLLEVQASLQAELQRGKELRRKVRAMQRLKSSDREEGLDSEREDLSRVGFPNQSSQGPSPLYGSPRELSESDDSQAIEVKKKSFAELSSRLEHFRERRKILLQQLTQLSIEPFGRSLNSPAKSAGDSVVDFDK